MLLREPFRDEPAEMLGAAEHFGAVSLNDECDLHESEPISVEAE